jgi:hypothetical protein
VRSCTESKPVVHVSDLAEKQARDYGLHLSGENLTRLLIRFVEESAIVTHKLGNRRYGDYVLDVEDETLYGIYKYIPGRYSCPDCYGVGFHKMRNGRGWTNVPCQNCTTDY